ncbi:MAG: hypothetical protein ACO24Y_08120 [Hylemonella sp.]
MFTLTRAAAQQIQQAAQDSGAKDMVLRVAARRMADGSLDYGMGFDESADSDTRLLIEDVAVVLAPSHAQLLEDTVLDFVELEPGQFNFIFVNQQSAFTSGSGCGSGGCASSGCSSGACGSGSSH